MNTEQDKKPMTPTEKITAGLVENEAERKETYPRKLRELMNEKIEIEENENDVSK